MDPQVPTLDLTHAPADPPAPPEMPKKDNHWITIMAMALFVLGSLAVVVFLYYQNQQLKTMLAGYQTKPSPSPSATADPTVNWKTYTDPNNQFSFRYPTSYILDTTSLVSPILNKNITWRFNSISEAECRGDCPVVESTENVQIDGMGAKRMQGYIGEVGGNIAQRFVMYEIKTGSKYLVFELQVTPLKLDAETYKKYFVPGKILDLNGNEKTTFDQILSTFKFFVSTPTPSSSPTPSLLPAQY